MPSALGRGRCSSGGASKWVALVAIASWLVGPACSATHAMGRPTSRDTLERVASATFDKPVEVELRHSADGDYQRSGTIESLRDGKMLLMKEHELHRIPMENVLRIEINNRAMGVRDGFVVGLLLSAVIAGLLYRSCGYCTPTARAASLFAILDLSFVIGPSVAIGGAIGHRTILDFENR